MTDYTKDVTDRVETAHGVVTRFNGRIEIQWRPAAAVPADVDVVKLVAGRLLHYPGQKYDRVVRFEGARGGREALFPAHDGRPDLVELADAAERMRADVERDAKRARSARPANGVCPRCGSYCYGDCTASRA